MARVVGRRVRRKVRRFMVGGLVVWKVEERWMVFVAEMILNDEYYPSYPEL